MKLKLILPCLIIAATARAQTPVIVDLGVADPATPRTYSVNPGAFDIKLVNADPRKTYEIVNDHRQATTTPKVPDDLKDANKMDPCTATDEAALNKHVQFILADKLAAKKKDAPADKQADVKLTEADIAAAVAADACVKAAVPGADAAKITADKTKYDADKAKFDADNTKFKADKAKFEADTTKPAAEKTRLDAEETRLKAEETRLGKVAAPLVGNLLLDRFTVTFSGYTLKAGEAFQKTFKVVGEDTTWTVVVIPQGGSAAVAAKAAAKAASPLASGSPILDRLLNTTASHPSLIVGNCKYTDADCGAKIYINSDQISTLTITDIPQGAVTVRITAGEYYPCQAVSYNIARYSAAPDTLIFPLHMRKGIVGMGNTRVENAAVEAASIYGLDWCPGTSSLLRRTGMFGRNSTNDDDYRLRVVKREVAKKNQREALHLDTKEKVAAVDTTILPTLADPRTEEFKAPPIASLPLFLRGKAEVVEVQFAWEDGTRKTFTFPVFYQRFWLDAGGFFVFTRRTDQSIDTETIPGTPEKQRLLAIRRDVSIEPTTGIVLNVHPGNFPILALQFGIAANQGHLPSYYLGLGIRAREIGKRGLATLGVGVAMQQEKQFPGLEFNHEYLSTSPLLQPTSKYGVTFPYISLSLGFSFGGVSEKTNVADSVQP